ncbi:protein BANP-like [Patiria miniata]|uniref:Protein BANP n=1 Tax=Patiria miniata TaxID=46514 RepID=A0A914AV96_PATMI|nr:protein BANP-like [Patiria miniata]XP_038068020.1 protein BANP-like [Patiria miniata]
MASIKAGETSDESILQMDVEEIPEVPTILNQGNLDDEGPMNKRQRLDDENARSAGEDSIKAILFNMNDTICRRLDSMERQLTSLQSTCIKMGRKVDSLNLTVSRALAKMKDNETVIETNGDLSLNNAVVVGIPSEEEHKEISSPKASRLQRNLNRNVTLITLNTEDDFPNGSWLGDEANLECRVRCGISPTDMLHVMQTSKTPEKCALKLLDFLFDRETQATSNLSGTGKHGKRQLDPLMIYGLRCHLIKHFAISDPEWHRIRMNIDSKCRTAFRRKQRGLPLTVKAFGYKTGTPENDQMIAYRYVDSQDAMNDSHSSDEGSNPRPTQVHVELAMDNTHLAELPQEEGQENHEGGNILKKVRIPQDSIHLQEGQINITQSGQIQIAVVEENGTAGTTLLLQQDTTVRDHHHHHSNEEEVVAEVGGQDERLGVKDETH